MADNSSSFSASFDSNDPLFVTIQWTTPTAVAAQNTTPSSLAVHTPPLSPITRTAIVAKCALLIPVVFTGIVGNALTLAAIGTAPRLRTKTNVFVASMAVADLLVAIALVYYIVYQLSVYIFGSPCQFIRMVAIVTPIQTVPMYVSCAHLALLAADRYIAIVYPFQYHVRVTNAVAGMLAASAWVVPSLMSLLQMFWIVRVDWNSCLPPYSVTVQFALSLVLYAFVSLVLIGAYARILRIAREHRVRINATTVSAGPRNPSVDGGSTGAAQAGNKTGKPRISRKTELKAAKMVSVVLMSFVILWFPNILGKAFQAMGRKDALSQYLIDIGIGLGGVNNSLNWVIYGIMNQDFRNAFKRLLTIKTMKLQCRQRCSRENPNF